MANQSGGHAPLDRRFLALTGGSVLATALFALAVLLGRGWQAGARFTGGEIGVLLYLTGLAALAVWLISLLPGAVLWRVSARLARHPQATSAGVLRPPYGAAALVALMGTGFAFAFLITLGFALGPVLALAGYGAVPLLAALVLTRHLYRQGVGSMGDAG